MPTEGFSTERMPAEPSIGELLEAVRERLDDAPAHPLGGYEARVVRNVVAMLERDIALGPAIDERHRERLRAFGAETDEELAAMVRAGDVEADAGPLRRALITAARDRLAINNPAWAQAPTIE